MMNKEVLKWRFLNPVTFTFAILFSILLILLLFFLFLSASTTGKQATDTAFIETIRFFGIYLYPYSLNFPKIIGGTQSGAITFLASIQITWLISLLVSAQPYQKDMRFMGSLFGIALSVFWALAISFLLLASGMA